ncbi:MAG: hypothetical protein FJ241_12565, partial [Nitrospira sp.]|nr:hypothetical protein [Nitrospira sp.]
MEIPYYSPSFFYECFASTDSFLLESIKGPYKIARYSFVGFDPYLIFKIKNGIIEIENIKCNPPIPSSTPLYPPLLRGELKGGVNNPLKLLKEVVCSHKQMPFESLPLFQGGAVGILSYDFVQYLERVPKNTVDDLNLPDA